MPSSIWMFLLAAAIYLGSFLFLVVAAFRVRVLYGFMVLLLPFAPLAFAIKYPKEGGTRFTVGLLAYVAMTFIVGSSPVLKAPLGRVVPGAMLVAHALGTQDAPLSHRRRDGQAPREARDLADDDPSTAASPTAVQTAAPTDPAAAQRADLVKHAAELNATYTELSKVRTQLKPGSPEVAAYNVRVAKYQEGLRTLAAEQAQLDARDKSSPATATATRAPLATPPVDKPAAGLPAQLAAARAERTAAMERVRGIVNQTPPPVSKPPAHAEVFGYAFHEGALTPDYAHADLYSTRELWKGEFVYMNARPGVYYRSADCEFNPQTKFFFTSRDQPKKKLTDPEIAEIVRLYRVIAADQQKMTAAQRQLRNGQTTSADLALNNQ